MTTGWRTNYLVFRAFGVENGEEELAVAVLTFGELESSKNLSERWRGRLCGGGWSAHGKHGWGEGERAIDLLNCSPGGVDKQLRVGGGVHGSWGEGRDEEGGIDIREERNPSISTPSEEKWN